MIAAVMRRDAAKAEDFAARHGVPHWYDDAALLMRDPRVDAIYIASPPATHRRYVLMAADIGKPVMVEKPMALHPSECMEMNAACAEAGVPLFVNYFRRALPRFIEIKRRLSEGEIGQLRGVNVSFSVPSQNQSPGAAGWRLEPELGGSPFMDTACHHFDLLDYLLGPIDLVQADVAQQAHCSNAEDLVTASFRFASGVQGAGLWCYSAGIDTDVVEIIGSRGVIAFPVFDLEAPILIESEEAAEQISVAPEIFVHQPMVQSVVDELNGGEACASTGLSACRTARVMDEIVCEFRAAGNAACEKAGGSRA
jgi:predicted dehydrogenase